MQKRHVLILGAASDVAKEMIRLYVAKGFHVDAASRSTQSISDFLLQEKIDPQAVTVHYWDAVDFVSHQPFYEKLPVKPSIVVYAAGYLVQNQEAFADWHATYQMINVHYAGAVSMLSVIINDEKNTNLQQIIGLSSLSGVRGRKSNFVYGSSKAAFTTFLAGLRQWLAPRQVQVNVIVAGYIRSKMIKGLPLKESLILEPEFIANAAVHAPKRFISVPGWKWKIIYQILKMLPESLVAKLP